MPVSRAQTKLMNQFSAYLRLQFPEKTQLADYLTDRDNGLCYGFAICDSVMAFIEKSTWWDEVKGWVADWDGTEASLQNVCDKENNLTVEEVFQLSMRYVFRNYAGASIRQFPFAANRVDQDDFLQPNNADIRGIFKIIMKGEIKTIQSHDAIAGHFEPKMLQRLLDDNREVIAKSICLTHFGDHACSLHFNLTDNCWYFRDCNDTSGKPSIFKHTDTLDLAYEIYNLGVKIKIECASFIEPTLKLNSAGLLQEIKQADLMHTSCLGDDGLFTMLRYTPDLLAQVIEHHKDSEHISANLVRMLSVQDEYQWTKLYGLANYSKKSLSKLIELGQTNSQIRSVFTQNLAKQTETKSNLLDYMMIHLPDLLPGFFDLVKTDVELQSAFAESFSRLDSNNDTCLGVFILFDSTLEYLPHLFDLTKSPKIRGSIAKALITENDSKETGFDILMSSEEFITPELKKYFVTFSYWLLRNLTVEEIPAFLASSFGQYTQNYRDAKGQTIIHKLVDVEELDMAIIKHIHHVNPNLFLVGQAELLKIATQKNHLALVSLLIATKKEYEPSIPTLASQLTLFGKQTATQSQDPLQEDTCKPRSNCRANASKFQPECGLDTCYP
ncbi:MAG: hypothetical protein ABI597_04340, partial [Gammaproteobacteria bacterium]